LREGRTMHDVIVVGAGPSGLNAAKILAKKGLNVLVLEKKSEVGEHVICAGIVGTEAFEKFDLSEESILKKIQEIKIVSPDSNTILYKHPETFAYVVDREHFDRSIAKDFEGMDIQMRCSTQVEDIVVDRDAVRVLTGANGKHAEQYSARVVLIATGVNYTLHRKLGLGHPRDFLHGVQAELDLGPVDHTHVFLGKSIATGAFAWLVPIGPDMVRIGLITEADPEGCFRRLVEKHFPSRMAYLNKKRVQFKPIAQGLTSRTYGERILVLGEAAGQVKTTTGGGIYFGLLCSEIASKVIFKAMESGDFSKSNLEEYEKSWKKAIQREIRVGYYARKVCAKLSDRQIEKIFRFIQSDGFIPLVQERGNFDWHSDLLMLLLKRIPFLQIWKSRTGENRQSN
jgi:digeranylgeranylglycerophospholipid reductase